MKRKLPISVGILYVLICALSIIITSSSSRSAAQQGNDRVQPIGDSQLMCRPVVDQAMVRVGASCDGLTINNACYGYNHVGAVFSQAVAANYFSAVSDRADVPMIRRIQTTPQTLDSPDWGIAILNVQANLPNALPGRGALMLLVGGANVRSDVKDDQVLPTAHLPVETARRSFIRAIPDPDANVIVDIGRAIPLVADAKDTSGDWVRVVSGDNYGWIEESALNSADFSQLPVFSADTMSPMQAITFNTGVGRTRCGVAPDMLIIQTPHGQRLNFRINDADVSIGSTVIFKTLGTDSILLEDPQQPSQTDVTRVAYHPDDKQVAVGYADGFIRIWNVDQPGQVVTRWQAHSSTVNGLAYIRQGNNVALLSSGADGSVALWSDSGQPKSSLALSNTQNITSFAVSASGLIALGHDDGSITLWEIASGQQSASLHGHTGAVTGLAFDANGTRLVSGGSDKTVRLWDVANAALVRTFTGHTESINSVDFRPDGLQIASSSLDGTIRLWNSADATFRTLNSGLVHSVRYSRDGSQLGAAADDADLQVWSTETGVRQVPMAGHIEALSSMDFDSTGYQAVSGSADDTARLWHVTPTQMRLIVIDGEAKIGSTSIKSDTYADIGLDQSGEHVVGTWTPPQKIDVAWSPEYYFITQLPPDVLLYPPDIPPDIIGGMVDAGLLPGSSAQQTPSPTPTVSATALEIASLPTTTATSPTFTFGGRFFDDLNSNGVQDPGESGMDGFSIGLGENPIVQNVITDVNGDYSFTAPPGQYYLQYPTIPGFSYGPGVDPGTGKTGLFTLDQDHSAPPVPQIRQTSPTTVFTVNHSVRLLPDGDPTNALSVSPGQIYEYTLTIQNTGSDYGTGESLGVEFFNTQNFANVLGASVTKGQLKSHVNQGPRADGKGGSLQYDWRVGSMAPGQTETLTVRVQQTPEGGDSTTSIIFEVSRIDGSSSAAGGSYPGPISVQGILPATCADLRIIQHTASINSAPAGSDITYTIEVENHNGDDVSGNVSVLVPVFGVRSSQPSKGTFEFTPETQLGTWIIPGLKKGESETLSVDTRLPYSGQPQDTYLHEVSMFADVADSCGYSDSNNPSKLDIGITTRPHADVAIQLSHQPIKSAYNSGDLIVYTVTITNKGPDTLRDMHLVDLLPDQLHPYDFWLVDPNYILATGSWFFGTLGANQSKTLTIYAEFGGTARETIQVTNEASFPEDQLDDPNLSDNLRDDTVTLLPPSTPVDVQLNMSANTNGVLGAGGSVNFAFTVTNTGTVPAENVLMLTNLPSDLSILYHDVEQGSFNEQSGSWDIGTLDANQSVKLLVSASAKSNRFDQHFDVTADVTTTSEDPVLDNNHRDVPLDVAGNPGGAADLHVDFFVPPTDAVPDPIHPLEGDHLHYQVRLWNYGPEDATNVQVSLLLPAGVTLVAADCCDGSYDPLTGIMTFDSAPAGNTPLVRDFEVVLDSGTAGQTLKLETEIIAADQPDPDSTPNNGANTEDDYASYHFIVGDSSATPEPTAEVTDNPPVPTEPVDGLPTIVIQPQSQTILSGQTANLFVEGDEILSYQWYQGNSGDTSIPIGGATFNFLTTPPLTTTTSYWVRVSNLSNYEDGDTATITVTPDDSLATAEALSSNLVQAEAEVTTIPDDTPPNVSIAPTSLSLNENSGAPSQYRIQLLKVPVTSVTIAVGFDPTQVILNGSSSSPVLLTFTSVQPQTVTVAAVKGFKSSSDRTTRITHTIRAGSSTEYLALILPNVTIGIPYVPPPPPTPLCTDENFDTHGVVRTGVPNAIQYAINCRILYQNGAPTTWLGGAIYNAGSIGIEGVLKLGVEQAIDIFSPAGMNYFEGGAVFCLRGQGTLIWMAASHSPRVAEIIGSYTVPDFPGFTCATLFEPGTLVLVSHTPAQ